MNIFLKSLSATAVLLAVSLSSFAQGGQKNWAVVEFSANLMREAPDYAAELGDQALMGTVVEVLDKSGYWVKVKSPEPYTAWVNEMGLVPMDEKELQDYIEAPKYICTASFSYIYEEPSPDSRIVSDLVLGDIVRIMYSVKTHTSGRYNGYEEGRAVLKSVSPESFCLPERPAMCQPRMLPYSTNGRKTAKAGPRTSPLSVRIFWQPGTDSSGFRTCGVAPPSRMWTAAVSHAAPTSPTGCCFRATHHSRQGSERM